MRSRDSSRTAVARRTSVASRAPRVLPRSCSSTTVPQRRRRRFDWRVATAARLIRAAGRNGFASTSVTTRARRRRRPPARGQRDCCPAHRCRWCRRRECHPVPGRGRERGPAQDHLDRRRRDRALDGCRRSRHHGRYDGDDGRVQAACPLSHDYRGTAAGRRGLAGPEHGRRLGRLRGRTSQPSLHRFALPPRNRPQRHGRERRGGARGRAEPGAPERQRRGPGPARLRRQPSGEDRLRGVRRRLGPAARRARSSLPWYSGRAPDRRAGRDRLLRGTRGHDVRRLGARPWPPRRNRRCASARRLRPARERVRDDRNCVLDPVSGAEGVRRAVRAVGARSRSCRHLARHLRGSCRPTGT